MSQETRGRGERETRRELIDLLDREADRARRNGSSFAFLHVEVDGAHGLPEASAAAVLAHVQGRLEGRLRRYDHILPYGERGFGIVLSDVRGGAHASAILAERLHDMLSLPAPTPSGEILPRPRVGLAAGAAGQPGIETLRQAGVAVARADREGPRLYDTEADERMRRRRRLDGDLRAALAAGEIQVAYQPLYDTTGDTVVGVEALARWTHEGRPVPPSEFIAHAEESGLIMELGEYVLRRACEDGARWLDITVAVNVSPVQLTDPLFPATVETILEETGLPPGRLEVEVTEGVFVSEPTTVSRRLEALRSLGVSVALDDFGTGYSSLGYLRSFPLDRVKIDRSFVADGGAQAQAIVEAVLGLAKALGMESTAEGVETEAQRAFLAERGCDRLQGFLLSRPVTAEAIDEMLAPPPGPGGP